MSKNPEDSIQPSTTTSRSDVEEIRFRTATNIGKQKVHYCPDWDFMAIWEGCPEMRACTCEFNE